MSSLPLETYQTPGPGRGPTGKDLRRHSRCVLKPGLKAMVHAVLQHQSLESGCQPLLTLGKRSHCTSLSLNFPISIMGYHRILGGGGGLNKHMRSVQDGACLIVSFEWISARPENPTVPSFCTANMEFHRSKCLSFGISWL